MVNLPKDCTARKIGTRAEAIVHYKLDSNYWVYHEQTGVDNGTDCIIELVEDDKFCNKKIEGQIKGTKSPKRLTNNDFSVCIEVKTINYGLSCKTAFVIFYVDTLSEKVYFLPLQEYFINNLSLFDKLKTDKKTLNIHIPKENEISSNQEYLKELAQFTYVNGPSWKLKRV